MDTTSRESKLIILPRYVAEYRRRYLSLGWSGMGDADPVNRYKAALLRLWRDARRELAEMRGDAE